MTRSLKIRQPRPYERRRLQRVVEETNDPQVRRRAEAILFYADGWNAVEIAAILKVHPNTSYADLHAFDQHGLSSLCPLARGGAPPRLTPHQREQIVSLAEREPIEFGLPYGRWSLSKFRDFLIHQQRLLQGISREHVRGLLKRVGIRFQRVRRKLISQDPNDKPFCTASGGFSSIYHQKECSYSLMLNRSPSKPMADDASVRPNGWSSNAIKKPGVGSTFF